MEVVSNVDNVRIREAIGSIRNELRSFLSQCSPILNHASKTFVAVLIREHLLLPEKDFAESLLEEDEADEKVLASLRQTPKLPRTLAKSWSDILKIMTEYELLPQLVQALHDFCSDSTPNHGKSFGKDMANAWICEILKSVQNKTAPSKTKLKKQKVEAKNDLLNLNCVDFKTDDAWQSVLHNILMVPNERTCSVLPLIARMMSMSQLQEKKILELIDLSLGKKLGDPTKQVNLRLRDTTALHFGAFSFDKWL